MGQAVEFLVRNGANVKGKDRKGNKASCLVSENGCEGTWTGRCHDKITIGIAIMLWINPIKNRCLCALN
jgi:hypothetical protein